MDDMNRSGMSYTYAPQGKKGFCIAALVLGIVAIVFGFIPYVGILGLICGGVGLLLGILGFKSYKDVGASSGLAVAGLVLSIVGTALAFVGFFVCSVPAISVCCAACNYASGLSNYYY